MQPWHSTSIESTFEQLKSNRNGLSGADAKKRLGIFGLNELPLYEGEPAWKLFLNQFRSPLMYIMFAAIVVAYFIEDRASLIFVSIVTLSNALVGFYQEYKANNTIRALKRLVKSKARVIRGGHEQQMLTSEIVPGDIIVLRPGDKVSSDARVFECDGLKAFEAILTGESNPVEKQVHAVSEKAEIGDRKSMVFMGTTIEDGIARAVVVETGIHTAYGDIARSITETPEKPTHLQQVMRSLSKTIGLFIALAVGLILLEGYFAGKPPQELFTEALALFISAIPEGLLPAITIVLAVGMNRVVKHKGLVRRLASTEALGGVTVICSDKTGTLTEGRMEARRIVTLDEDIEINTQAPGSLPLAEGPVRNTLTAAILVSDAYIENPEAEINKLIIRGRPTEQAVLKAGMFVGLQKDVLEKQNRALGTIFFSSEKKYSATLRKTPEGKTNLYVMGAPEQILRKTDKIHSKDKLLAIDSKEGKDMRKHLDELTEQGYRLLACAERPLDAKTKSTGLENEVKDLILLGFIAFNDPVRLQVPEALRQTRRAGIRTIIVTGDHQLTARAVAEKIGFKINPNEILEGRDVEEMTDNELRKKVASVQLYARVSPQHKLRIVQAFQSRGEVVAMFGDGVNDTPALKAAQIGVAVSPEVDAVWSTADLVLLDGGFDTIVEAIKQGRIIFYNIRRVFLYLLTVDFSEFFVFFIAIALKLPLPIVAAQILFINLTESGLPDLALTTEKEQEGIMEEKPRKPSESIAHKPTLIFMAITFFISGIVAFAFYYAALSLTNDLNLTRTMTTVLLCFESLFLSLSLRSFKKGIIRKNIFSNKLLTGAVAISALVVVAAIYINPLQNLLSFVPLSPAEWLIIILVNLAGVILVDRIKIAFLAGRKKNENTGN